MKMEKTIRIMALLVVFAFLAPTAYAANDTNDSNDTLQDDIADAVGGIGETGNEAVDGITDFLADASPFILIALAILLFVLSSVGKWIAIILIILAIAKIAWTFLA